jgi:hypothetical protein
MTGLWKAWKSKNQDSQLFPRAPWESRQQQARFPHFHSSGGAYLFQTEPQARKESGSVGHGKVEIQNQDSHFPTAPTACGSKEESHS